MDVILNSWMFSIEYLFIFAAVYIGIFIWMWKSDFKLTKPKKGDEWVVVTVIKDMWEQITRGKDD